MTGPAKNERAPRVFVSHAGEDKARFVLEFATRLRAKGVDAWLDRWEMGPGDSLVEKIFDEGLKSADAIVIVLSHNTIDKRWVKEELDAAMVHKIERSARLIPVVIDDCAVPESLKTVLWERIDDLRNYDDSFDRIVRAIYGHRERPPLGPPPPYAVTPDQAILGVEQVDTAVLVCICKLAVADGDNLVESDAVISQLHTRGLSEGAVRESLEVLHQDGFIELSRDMNGPPRHLRITLSGFEVYADSAVPRYREIQTLVVAQIVNERASDTDTIASTLQVSSLVVEHVFRVLESRGYLQLSRQMSGPLVAVNASPKLRRLLL